MASKWILVWFNFQILLFSCDYPAKRVSMQWRTEWKWPALNDLGKRPRHSLVRSLCAQMYSLLRVRSIFRNFLSRWPHKRDPVWARLERVFTWSLIINFRRVIKLFSLISCWDDTKFSFSMQEQMVLTQKMYVHE